jgi:ATP-dependent RNA helicase DDX10/DBP4
MVCGQAFVSYLRSVYLHKDKTIFKIDELPVDRYAESLGLPGAPKIKFLGKEIAKKNASRTVVALQAEIAREQAAKREDKSDDGLEGDSSAEEEIALPVDSMHVVDEPTAKASKVCPPTLTPWPSTEYLVSVCYPHKVRPDVRAQKPKVRTLHETH